MKRYTLTKEDHERKAESEYIHTVYPLLNKNQASRKIILSHIMIMIYNAEIELLHSHYLDPRLFLSLLPGETRLDLIYPRSAAHFSEINLGARRKRE